jgi:branched-chain amino acid aminotransferase
MTQATDKLDKSLYDDYDAPPYIHINGALVERAQALIPALDHGFMHGDGCFEALVVTAGRVFMLDAHMERMRRSLRSLRIEYDVDLLARSIAEVVTANGLTDSFVKAIVSRGAGVAPSLDPRGLKPTAVVFGEPLMHLVDPEAERRGVILKTAALRRTNPAMLDAKVKSLNYLNNVLAKLEAIDAGADEALLLDSSGEVAEATAENIFVVHGELVRTPSSIALLEGITRGVVERLAADAGFQVERARLTLGDVYSADEVFLTSTAGGVIPVGGVDGRVPARGPAGPVVTELRRRYELALTDPAYSTELAALLSVTAD